MCIVKKNKNKYQLIDKRGTAREQHILIQYFEAWHNKLTRVTNALKATVNATVLQTEEFILTLTK